MTYDPKKVLYFCDSCGEMKDVRICEMWNLLADDVRDELNSEGLDTLAKFANEIRGADTCRFLFRKDDKRIIGAFWSNTFVGKNNNSIRSMGCVLRGKEFKDGDRMIIGRYASSVLDWYVSLEPKFVDSVVIGIPKKFDRLIKFAKKTVGLKTIVDNVVGKYGVTYTVFGRRRVKC